MKSRFACALLGLGLIITQTVFGAGRAYAVLIGIADYRATTRFSGDLRYADADAKRMALFLQSRAGGNVPPSNIRLLVNGQATKQAIENALGLFQSAQPGDRIIFYFSGHGLPGGFIPYDVKLGSANIKAGVLTYDAVKQAFRSSAASVKLCIADACYAGSMTARKTLPDNLLHKPTQIDKTVANTALILATRFNQQAIEARPIQGGLFTYFLLQGMQGRADVNNDRVVTIRELYTFVTPKMRQVLPRMVRGQSIDRRAQAPLFYGNFSDDLPIVEFR